MTGTVVKLPITKAQRRGIEMSDEERPPRGYISTEWTFWCGRCCHWEQIGTENKRSEAIKVARRSGWKLTAEHGWVCSKHKGE